MKQDNKIFLLLILCMVMLVAAGCRENPQQPPQTDGGLTVETGAPGTSGGTGFDQTVTDAEKTTQPEGTTATEVATAARPEETTGSTNAEETITPDTSTDTKEEDTPKETEGPDLPQEEQTEPPEQPDLSEEPEQGGQTEQPEQEEQIPANTEGGWGPIH